MNQPQIIEHILEQVRVLFTQLANKENTSDYLWYNLVLIWAYLGIMLKQMEPPGDYLTIAFSALGVLIILVIVNAIVLIKRKKIYA